MVPPVPFESVKEPPVTSEKGCVWLLRRLIMRSAPRDLRIPIPRHWQKRDGLGNVAVLGIPQPSIESMLGGFDQISYGEDRCQAGSVAQDPGEAGLHVLFMERTANVRICDDAQTVDAWRLLGDLDEWDFRSTEIASGPSPVDEGFT